MKYYIEEITDCKVVYMRRIGQYGKENYALMSKMKAWADTNGLLSEEAVIYGIALDNPQLTKPTECRYDVCLLTLNIESIESDSQISVRKLNGGRYAVFTIEHTADAIANFWQSFSTEVYSCGVTMDISRPIMERYSVKMVANGLCEMCVPVMPLEVRSRFKFNTVGLFTTDNKATVDFYTKAFGFTTSWDGEQPNVEMALGEMRIILFPRDAFEQMVSQKFQYPQGLNGTMELSFDVPSFADVDKEYQNALNNGAKSVLPPTTEPWGQRTCYVADPDGNLIEIGSFVEE